GKSFVAVRVASGDVDGDRILVADVLGERLAALAIEHDDPHHPLQADEEVVLAALVIVEAADHALARPREIRLPDRLREPADACKLRKPAALVLVPRQRKAFDDHLFTPVSSTRRPTS